MILTLMFGCLMFWLGFLAGRRDMASLLKWRLTSILCFDSGERIGFGQQFDRAMSGGDSYEGAWWYEGGIYSL
jgi:hypothetical protein